MPVAVLIINEALEGVGVGQKTSKETCAKFQLPVFFFSTSELIYIKCF